MLANVESSDLDLVFSLLPGGGDLPTYLTTCLDRLIEATDCSRACIVTPNTEGQLEFQVGRDTKQLTLHQSWPEICWASLVRSIQRQRVLISQTSRGMAVPMICLGEVVGALYLNFPRGVLEQDSSILDPLRRVAQVLASEVCLVLLQSRARFDLEQTQARLRDEIAEKVALRKRVEELERINEDLGRFVHFASHDLQEPLRALTGYSTMLAQQMVSEPDTEARRFLEQITGAATKMSGLLRELRDFATLGESQGSLQQINTGDVFHQVCSELAPRIREARAQIVEGELPRVMADPPTLRLLFKALLDNALLYRRGSSPRIEVGSSCSPTHCRIWVRDNGIGIDPQFSKAVFQPFRRLHPPDEYPGNGLGLTTARRIVERHHGQIWIEPNSDFGITVFFELPGIANFFHQGARVAGLAGRRRDRGREKTSAWAEPLARPN